MNYSIIEDSKFKYIEKGEGEVLLLLHGLFGSLSNFQYILDEFQDEYKVVMPILPMFELPIREISVMNFAHFVHDFVTYKNYDKVHILGNSLGGHIALLYVLNHEEKVKSLILTGSSGLFEKGLGSTMPKRGDYDYIKARTELTFYDPNVATKELVDEVFDMVNDREKGLRIVSAAKSAMRHNLSEELRAIHQPTLLIWGQQDQITPPFVGEEFKKLIPHAELYFLDKCGHAPMMELPNEFNVLLRKFLAGVKD